MLSKVSVSGQVEHGYVVLFPGEEPQWIKFSEVTASVAVNGASLFLICPPVFGYVEVHVECHEEPPMRPPNGWEMGVLHEAVLDFRDTVGCGRELIIANGVGEPIGGHEVTTVSCSNDRMGVFVYRLPVQNPDQLQWRSDPLRWLIQLFPWSV